MLRRAIKAVGVVVVSRSVLMVMAYPAHRDVHLCFLFKIRGSRF